MICSSTLVEAAALSTAMMPLFSSFASASSPPGTPCQSANGSNSKMYTICTASVIATPSGRLPQKQFMKKDTESRSQRFSWSFLTGIVNSISCAFSARSSSLQILRNSSCRHSMLMLLSLSSVWHMSLLLGFCVAYMLSCRCLQAEWWAAVSFVAIPSQAAMLM